MNDLFKNLNILKSDSRLLRLTEFEVCGKIVWEFIFNRIVEVSLQLWYIQLKGLTKTFCLLVAL